MKIPFRFYVRLPIYKAVLFACSCFTALILSLQFGLYFPFVIAFIGVLFFVTRFNSKTMDTSKITAPYESLSAEEMYKRYYELSDIIKKEKDNRLRLRACEESYTMIKVFVDNQLEEFGDIPPTILCRDVGIKLYMRVGQWLRAENAIKKCVAAGIIADGGRADFEYLARYVKAAKVAIKFLQSHEGYLQKNIYKALNSEDEFLKKFIRSTLLIDKVKFGDTNKLFINNKVYVESDFHWRRDCF